MMRSIFVRELAILARSSALIVIICAHVGLLAAFVIVWGGHGVPGLPGENVYEQRQVVQWVLLACLLPWAAARSFAAERGDDLVALAACAGLRPSHVVLAKLCATFVALALIVTSVLPAVFLAQQMSAVPLTRVWRDQMPLVGFAALVSGVTFGWLTTCRDRLAGWLAATASTLLILVMTQAALSSEIQAAAVFATLAIATAASLVIHADSSLRYLSEERA